MNYIKSVKSSFELYVDNLAQGKLGKYIELYDDSINENHYDFDIAVFTVSQNDNSYEFEAVRKEFYNLYVGNWDIKIVDLGVFVIGSTTEDTNYALKEQISSLIKNNVIPVVIGDDHGLTFSMYKAYDSLEQMVNLTAVDYKFDLGVLGEKLSSDSFLGHILSESPSNLFNYSSLGFQTYLNSQEEIDMLDKLSFDAYRLGVAKDMKLTESILRDSDIVSIDLSSVRMSDSSGNNKSNVNGFYAEEICAIARYSGISDKVSSFGVFDYNKDKDIHNQTAQLLSQMIWYFIDGVNSRALDYPYCGYEEYAKYSVVIDDIDTIEFMESNKTGRWWMKINKDVGNKKKRHALVPCTEEDYIEALKGNVPDRWIKALNKFK